MVQASLQTGGYRDPKATWMKTQEAMVNAMVRLELAVKPHLEGLDA
jgi:hypothetical protein